MQWFKHDTNATMDFKIKKLLIRYGAIGYAVYFHCLELIADSVDVNNITFELEHDSEIIADDLRIKGTSEKSGRELVEEIMRYMVELNLFQEDNGHIFCFKMLKRIDTSMTSNTKFREVINEAKKNHDAVMITSDSVMQDKTRKEETRKEKKRLEENKEEGEQAPTHPKARFLKPTLEEIREYCLSRNNYVDPERFYDYYEANGWKVGKNPMKDWRAAVRTWESREKSEAPKKLKKEQHTDEEYEAMCDDLDNTPF